MSDYKDIFRTKESQIFCKAWVAVHITRDGLVDFVDKEFQTFHSNILSVGFNCLLCTTEDVLESKAPLRCSGHGHIRDAIHREHRFSKPKPRYSGPSWKNSKAENWKTSSWDVAKCFMPIGGYLDKTTAAETDFNGIIGAIINCKHFQNLFTADLSKDNNICTEVRKKVNEIRHFMNMEPGINDADLNDYIDLFIDLLNDTKSLQGDLKATEARDKLNKLKLDTLAITTEEAGEILKDALTELKKLQNDLHTTMDSAKLKALNKMKDKLDDACKHLNEVGKEQVKKIEDAGSQVVKLLENEKTKGCKELWDHKSETLAGIEKKEEYSKTNVINVGTEQLNNIKERTVSALNEVTTRKTAAVVEIKEANEAAKKECMEVGTENMQLIKETASDVKRDIESLADYREAEFQAKKEELRHDLAHHYLTEHDSMPLSPLMPEVDDKLTKFYMSFKMNKVDTKTSVKSVQTTESVNSYKSLFYSDNNYHKNIYIQGEAGMGKSSFCTKLGLMWSAKHIPKCSKTDSSTNRSTANSKEIEEQVFSDENIITEFDFVFSLALRNVEGECEIQNMIENQIISGLPDHSKYDGLVPKILAKERCLIILDGLDEWSHRSDLCKKLGLIPHRKSWSRTTVLTSTRPWKMNEVRLRDSEISILIQITGITDSATFTENVLNCLNDKFNTTLDVKDFITCMVHNQLNHFLDIPVVAMQLLCLWHSDHELGDSKCKIYMNMLDMLFGRAQDKSTLVCDDIPDTPKTGLPTCFESTMFCEQHIMLLDCLGSLAFYTLHSHKREDSLVFNDAVVTRHMKSTTLKTALTTGLLSQHKSPSLIARRSHFSFLYKTFQEFLAAYYIATHADESENIVKTLFQVYGQTVYIMDISELFTFVCGMNPEMSFKISESVMKSFSVHLINHIEALLVSDDNYNVEGMTKSLQQMILAGYKEGNCNGHKDPQLALHHVYYRSDISDDEKTVRDRLVDRNIDKIVTLCAGTYSEKCTVDIVKIQQILTQSCSTLSHVSLLRTEGLTDACLDLFTDISLKSLHLCDMNTHFDIKLNTSSLLNCYLGYINKEVEHSVLSALTAAPQLHTLIVENCKNMSVLCRVLPTLPSLHRFYVWDDMIPASLCHVFSTLSQLQILIVNGHCEDPSLMCQTLSTVSNLQYIKLYNTDLVDNAILLPNSIQQIELHQVKLTCRSCRQLVDRMTQIPHQVTCILWKCTVSPVEEYDAIVKHIQQSDMFEIHENAYIDSDGYIWLHFTKTQT